MEDLKREECYRKCEPADILLMSNPPQYRCKNCKETWMQGNPTPICHSAPKGCCAIDIFGQHEINCPKFGAPPESPKECEHGELEMNGYKGKCLDCGNELDFSSPQPWEELAEELAMEVTEIIFNREPGWSKKLNEACESALLSAREEERKKVHFCECNLSVQLERTRILEALPKEKNRGVSDYSIGWSQGFNECLSELIKIIKETP